MRSFSLIAKMMLILVVFMGTVKSDHLGHQHQITLGIGVWDHEHNPGIETGLSNKGVIMETNGYTGKVSWKYFLSDKLATNVSFGLRSAGFDASITMDSAYFDAVSVYHVLFGFSYYPSLSKNFSPIRPFISAVIGPYVADLSVNKTNPLLEMSYKTETTFGGRLGVGFDFLMGRSFSIGLGLGYNYMADFKHSIAGNKNYNGSELTFNISYLIGTKFNRSKTTN
jgi:hypothetical protein